MNTMQSIQCKGLPTGQLNANLSEQMVMRVGMG